MDETSLLHDATGALCISNAGHDRAASFDALPRDAVCEIVNHLLREAPWKYENALCARRLSRTWRDCADALVRARFEPSMMAFYEHMLIRRELDGTPRAVLTRRVWMYFTTASRPDAGARRYRCARCNEPVKAILDRNHACIRPRTWVHIVAGPVAALALVCVGLKVRCSFGA